MRYTFLASFAFTALATAAFAQGGDMGLMRADTNNDGMVSKAEVEALAGARFDAKDLNKDGFLTADEMMAGRRAQVKDRPAASPVKVSRADWIARADKRFARLDTNGDGMLSRDEMQAGKNHMRGADPVTPPPSSQTAR